jgi:hypothetical protein
VRIGKEKAVAFRCLPGENEETAKSHRTVYVLWLQSCGFRTRTTVCSKFPLRALTGTAQTGSTSANTLAATLGPVSSRRFLPPAGDVSSHHVRFPHSLSSLDLTTRTIFCAYRANRLAHLEFWDTRLDSRSMHTCMSALFWRPDALCWYAIGGMITYQINIKDLGD